MIGQERQRRLPFLGWPSIVHRCCFLRKLPLGPCDPLAKDVAARPARSVSSLAAVGGWATTSGDAFEGSLMSGLKSCARDALHQAGLLPPTDDPLGDDPLDGDPSAVTDNSADDTIENDSSVENADEDSDDPFDLS